MKSFFRITPLLCLTAIVAHVMTTAQRSTAQDAIAQAAIPLDSISQLMAARDAGPSAQPDPRVQSALEAQGLTYSIDANGNYLVEVQYTNGRGQVAWITSETQTVGSLELRAILSPAYESTAPLSAEVANLLLQDSAQRNLGGWQTLQQDGSSITLFLAQVDATSQPEQLEAALLAVLGTADEMEAQLIHNDQF